MLVINGKVWCKMAEIKFYYRDEKSLNDVNNKLLEIDTFNIELQTDFVNLSSQEYLTKENIANHLQMCNKLIDKLQEHKENFHNSLVFYA